MANSDLAAWDDHCRFGFETRGLDATMATRMGDPHVNHIPIKRFYRRHLIEANPEGARLIPVSRTWASSEGRPA